MCKPGKFVDDTARSAEMEESAYPSVSCYCGENGLPQVCALGAMTPPPCHCVEQSDVAIRFSCDST